MVAQIVVNQMGKPAGVAGRAREDLDTGMTVVLSAAGGPFSVHLWELVDAPLDLFTPAQSAATLATPTASTTNLSPIDNEGTYKVRLTVDSGSGLGATAADIAEITFAAYLSTNPLASDPAELPRRVPAFTERTEHNVVDALFPAGNPRGHATELDRWFAVIRRIAPGASFAWAKVDVATGGPAVALSSFNCTVNWLSTGTVEILFTRHAANNSYAVVHSPRGGTVGATSLVSFESTSSFRITTRNSVNALTDMDFSVDVKA